MEVINISYLRTEYWDNQNWGEEIYTEVLYYSCDECGKEICESDPHYEQKEKYNNGKWRMYQFSESEFKKEVERLSNVKHYCWDCAFKKQFIDSDEYLKNKGIASHLFTAFVQNNEIKIIYGSDTDRKQRLRNSKKYKKWRLKVFKRDDYTCTHCGKRGGNLNAHHIKSFANCPDLRFKLENGITLCKKCHKKEHSTGGD